MDDFSWWWWHTKRSTTNSIRSLRCYYKWHRKIRIMTRAAHFAINLPQSVNEISVPERGHDWISTQLYYCKAALTRLVSCNWIKRAWLTSRRKNRTMQILLIFRIKMIIKVTRPDSKRKPAVRRDGDRWVKAEH